MEPGDLRMGYKGKSFMDSGYIYAPYVPITTTPVVIDCVYALFIQGPCRFLVYDDLFDDPNELGVLRSHGRLRGVHIGPGAGNERMVMQNIDSAWMAFGRYASNLCNSGLNVPELVICEMRNDLPYHVAILSDKDAKHAMDDYLSDRVTAELNDGRMRLKKEVG